MGVLQDNLGGGYKDNLGGYYKITWGRVLQDNLGGYYRITWGSITKYLEGIWKDNLRSIKNNLGDITR